MMDIFSVKRRMAVGDPLWWSLDGFSKANCLAAWKFKHRNSQEEAMKDLTGNGYTLTNSGCTWSESGIATSCISNNGNNGGKYLDNASLRSNGKSIVMKISNASHGGGASPLGSIGGVGLFTSTPFLTQSFWYEVSGQIGVTHENGLSTDYSGGGSLSPSKVKIGGWQGSGTFGFTLSGEALYKNGSAISLGVASYSGHGNWTGFIASSVPRLVGGYVNVNANTSDQNRWNWLGHHPFAGGFTIEALAVYSANLSQAQHQLIYKNMLFI